MSAEQGNGSGSGNNGGNLLLFRQPPVEEGLLTAGQVSKELQCSDSLIYKAAKRGELPSFLLWGRLRRFRREEVRQWLEAQRRGGGKGAA